MQATDTAYGCGERLVQQREMRMDERHVPVPAALAADGDAIVRSFDGGWRLTVTLHKGAVSGATAELRSADQHFAITRQSTVLFDLAAQGFEPMMSVDSQGNPTVIWEREGASPFVWFCGLDVADWSHPL